MRVPPCATEYIGRGYDHAGGRSPTTCSPSRCLRRVVPSQWVVLLNSAISPCSISGSSVIAAHFDPGQHLAPRDDRSGDHAALDGVARRHRGDDDRAGCDLDVIAEFDVRLQVDAGAEPDAIAQHDEA